MKVQAINNSKYNQNKISHKASFKPNVDLEYLCKIAKKDDSLLKAVDTFKHSLPNQELELKKIPMQHSSWYRITNHSAKKEIFAAVNLQDDGLKSLLDGIIHRKEALFSQKEEVESKFDLYKELLTK